MKMKMKMKMRWISCAQLLVDAEVAYRDLAAAWITRIVLWRSELQWCAVDSEQPRVMLGLHDDLMLTGLPRVFGHNCIFVPDLEAPRQLVHGDRGSDQSCWHRVAAAGDAHQCIIGDDALPDVRPLIGRPHAERCESLPSEAREGRLMRRTVLSEIGDGRRPLQEPCIEMRPGKEALPGKRISLHILHARLDLTLGLWPVRSACPWAE